MKSNSTEKRILLSGAAVFSLSGLILRFLQLKNELLPDGSLAEGAFLHHILLILSICFVIGISVLLWRLPRLTSWKQCFPPKPVYEILHLAAAVLLLVGNAAVLIGGPSQDSVYIVSAPGFSSFLNRILPILGIAAAVCLGVFAWKCRTGSRPSPLLYMCVSLYLIIRLIVCFQAWNTDPSIHDYCYMLLAAICTMLATFQLAGFCFDKGKRRITLFWTLTSVFFCSMSLADAIGDGSLGTVFITLALLLTTAVSSLQLLFCSETVKEEAAAEETEKTDETSESSNL